ncbi:MAG: sensor histidine kinase [Pseudomonadota bacterium]
MTSPSDLNDEHPLSNAAGRLSTTPAFNLIYLVFLLFPWIWVKPRLVDVAVAMVVLAIFIPLHLKTFFAPTRKRLLPIAITALLGSVCSFFVLGAGVFQVYCGAMAGFCRPVKLSGLLLGLCAVVFTASAWMADRALVEMGFILFMSAIVWFSCLSTAQTLIDNRQLEREHELDRQTASLMERERIGRDLHDLLGHTLTMVALKSDLARRLIDTDPAQAKAEIGDIQTGARQALQDVRAALSGLAAVSIAGELANARKALGAADVSLSVTGHVPTLSADQDQAIGLMIREAVTNIIRHTDATDAHIEFSVDDAVQTVTVRDNGGGQIGAEGRGLSGLRRRIEALGGTVQVAGNANDRLSHAMADWSGVSISASLPVTS